MDLDTPQVMLAWQKHFPSTTPIRNEVPIPIPIKDEILVKIHAAGVCHSDYALREADKPPADWPEAPSKFTFGHEGCGEVVSTGPEAKKFRRGDVVALLMDPGCTQADCIECSGGATNLCLRGPRYGAGQDGFFAAYVTVTERAAVMLPPGVSAAAGAVATDACMTAYHAVVGRAAVKRGETVLLLGLGGLGFNALQILLYLGARVIVSDKRQVILDQAAQFGVPKQDIIPADTANVSDWIQKRKIRVDKAIDFVAVPATFEAAVASVRLAGTIVLVGLLALELTLTTSKVVRKQLSVLGSYAGTIADLEACLGLIAKGYLVPQVSEAKMSNFPTILEDLHHGKFKGRIVLVPDDSDTH